MLLFPIHTQPSSLLSVCSLSFSPTLSLSLSNAHHHHSRKPHWPHRIGTYFAFSLFSSFSKIFALSQITLSLRLHSRKPHWPHQIGTYFAFPLSLLAHKSLSPLINLLGSFYALVCYLKEKSGQDLLLILIFFG